jgi:hypothetical protein
VHKKIGCFFREKTTRFSVQQRAYFADVDAFELAEEKVSGSELE